MEPRENIWRRLSSGREIEAEMAFATLARRPHALGAQKSSRKPLAVKAWGGVARPRRSCPLQRPLGCTQQLEEPGKGHLEGCN
jgi:hypothetical protein